MCKRHFGILCFGLISAACLGLAQNTPTGIVKSGSVGLVRGESKVTLANNPPVENVSDIATAGFQVMDYTQYTPPPAPQTTQIGPCFITQISTPASSGTVGITNLDAGPVINVNGPNGTKQITQSKGVYTGIIAGGPQIQLPISIPGLPGSIPLFLDPGTYTADNGGGGADVGPFSVTLNVPSPGFLWTNADADTSIDRSAGVDIQFSGGDPNTNVYIQGSVTISDPATFQVTGGAAFFCSVPNNGDFVVTSDVLSLLPATPAGAAGPTSTLTAGQILLTTFSASGIDTGTFSYAAGNSRSVIYK